jgi:mannose-6-phosphate isomerase-like protein (cupin superfamily)
MSSHGYSIVVSGDVDDVYAGTDVPGEFRPLTEALDTEQLALTLICIPPHSDFEQGTAHTHAEIEEIYLVTRGTLTMRFNDDVVTVTAGSAVRVAPSTARSHRNEQDEPVELWAISTKTNNNASTKIEAFWEPSPQARQHRTR